METEHVKLLMQVFGLITEPVYEQILMPPLSSNTHTLPPRHSCELIPVHNFFLYSDFKASRFVNVSLWVLFHSTLHPPRGWATQQACPYKQTAPRLAAGHRLGNSESGRSRSLFFLIFFFKVCLCEGLAAMEPGYLRRRQCCRLNAYFIFWTKNANVVLPLPPRMRLPAPLFQSPVWFDVCKILILSWQLICSVCRAEMKELVFFFLFLVKFCFFILFFLISGD